MYPERLFDSIQKISTLKELSFKYCFIGNRAIPNQEKYRKYCLENNISLTIQ